jgi:sarcosine/dimethylglycine N-methyltransferase
VGVRRRAARTGPRRAPLVALWSIASWVINIIADDEAKGGAYFVRVKGTDAMNNERVRAHYDTVGLLDRVRSALSRIAPNDAVLTPEQLAGLDQFHTRGLAATHDLASAAALVPGERVLDLGCGIGGPARVFAGQYGVTVHGIDLSAPFIETGNYLNERCGLRDAVTLEVDDVTSRGFADSDFDAVFLQHVAMNIADRAALYRGAAAALKPNGRFATYDVVRGDGEIILPVPWSREPATNHLLSVVETRAAIEAAGLVIDVCEDGTDAALAWFSQLAAGGPPPGLNLGLVMGAEFRAVAGNLGRNLREGRARILTAIARKPA